MFDDITTVDNLRRVLMPVGATPDPEVFASEEGTAIPPLAEGDQVRAVVYDDYLDTWEDVLLVCDTLAYQEQQERRRQRAAAMRDRFAAVRAEWDIDP